MARSPNVKAEQARKLYKTGMKLVEIASQLDVPAGTVRRWKSTYHWEGEQIGERSNNKVNARKEKQNVTNKVVAEEVKQVMQNTNLTNKQQLFCIYYIRCFNATRSYQKAYGCTYTTAMVEGCKLLRNPKVKIELIRLKQEKLNREFFTEEDVFQKFMDIAFADIGDYLSFGQLEVPQWKNVDGMDIPIIDPNTGEQKVNSYNVVELEDSKNVDTSIISEVSEGKEGVKVKLADRMKALQWLSDHMNLATDKQRAEIALLKSKVETDNPEDEVNDGFIEALSSTAGEDWSDEED